MNEAGVALTLYSRLDCPLCEKMQEQLELWSAQRGGVELAVVDIASDAELNARYWLRIPVLNLGDTEVCFGTFHAGRLEALLNSA